MTDLSRLANMAEIFSAIIVIGSSTTILWRKLEFWVSDIRSEL